MGGAVCCCCRNEAKANDNGTENPAFDATEGCLTADEGEVHMDIFKSDADGGIAPPDAESSQDGDSYDDHEDDDVNADDGEQNIQLENEEVRSDDTDPRIQTPDDPETVPEYLQMGKVGKVNDTVNSHLDDSDLDTRDETATPEPDSVQTHTDSEESQTGIAHPEVESGTIVRALYGWEAVVEGDITFEKDDLFKIVTRDGDWWEVVKIKSEETGYIPCNYVVKEYSLELFDWYHGSISRAAAVELLRSPGNEPGTFLVRESNTKSDTYTISILAADVKNGRRDRHHRIFTNEAGEFYLEESNCFKYLSLLVEFYQIPGTHLHTTLKCSCPKTLPTRTELSHATKDRWEIDRKSLTFEAKIGGGKFGEVWKGNWEGMVPVAIKQVKPATMSTQAFIEEAAVMKKLHHEHLVKLYAVCTNEEPILIVLEYMIHGSLLNYLRNEELSKTLDSMDLIMICQQVALAMDYMERQSYIHRDLAARNVLVGENKIVKVADFGMARLIEDDEYQTQSGKLFPYKWTAPEAAYRGKFSIKSDVWSYGILMVEIMSKGETPYTGFTNAETLQKVKAGYRHPAPDDCPEPVYDIMMKCWLIEPSDRPSFKDITKLVSDLLTYQDAQSNDESPNLTKM